MNIQTVSQQAPQAPQLPETFPAGAIPTTETFSFKRRPVKGADGEQLTDEKGEKLWTTPPDISIIIPLLNQEGLVNLIQDETTQASILNHCTDLINDAIYSAAQVQVTALVNAGKTDITPEDLNYSVLSAMYLATAPKTSARGGIPKDLWPDWTNSFVNTLTKNFGVSTDGATKSAKLIQTRFVGVETNEKILGALKAYLDNWFAKASEADQLRFEIIYSQMLEKIENLTESAEKNLLAALA